MSFLWWLALYLLIGAAGAIAANTVTTEFPFLQRVKASVIMLFAWPIILIGIVLWRNEL